MKKIKSHRLIEQVKMEHLLYAIGSVCIGLMYTIRRIVISYTKVAHRERRTQTLKIMDNSQYM